MCRVVQVFKDLLVLEDHLGLKVSRVRGGFQDLQGPLGLRGRLEFRAGLVSLESRYGTASKNVAVYLCVQYKMITMLN